MNAVEVVIREVQGNRSFQMRQLPAERIPKPRKASHRHAHCNVLPFDEARLDFFGIRIARADLGYNLREQWWGVLRIGIFHVTKEFHKLRKGELTAALRVYQNKRDAGIPLAESELAI